MFRTTDKDIDVVNEDVDTGHIGHVSARIQLGFTSAHCLAVFRCIWLSSKAG